ncbi:MAG: type IX secretion system motor protein PorL/GldL [Bacteroidia bacterium]
MSSKLPKITGYKKYLHIVASGGASVVIVGALFKIQHYPGAGPMLMVGLLVEALIFLLYAFDIPHEEYDWSLAYPELSHMNLLHEEEEKLDDDGLTASQKLDKMLEEAKIGPELLESLGSSMRSLSDNANKIADVSNAHMATTEYVDSVKTAAKNVSGLSETYSKASESLAKNASGLSETYGKASESLMGLSDSYTKASEAVINFSKSNEAGSTAVGDQLGKVSKNLSALNASYELQLQGSSEHIKATSQFYDSLGNLMKNLHDSVDDTRKYKTEMSSLSTNLSALNQVYGNMLTAMNFKQQ